MNPSAPALIGNEWMPQTVQQVVLDQPYRCALMRVKPGVTTLTHIEVFLSSVVGNPGLAVEIIDTVNPAVFPGQPTNTVYPGSDTSSVVTGWTDNLGPANALLAAKLGSTSRFGLANYGRNQSAVVGPAIPLSFRGASAPPATSRFFNVRGGVTVELSNTGLPTTSSPSIALTLDLLLNGGATRYKSPALPVSMNNAFSDLLGPVWQINPFTALPWTAADITNLVNGTDEFGTGLASGSLVALALWVASTYLKYDYVTENRHGFNYALATPPRVGWNKQALSSATATLANTWYWIVISCPNASPTNYATVPILNFTTGLANPASAGAGVLGEVRQYGQSVLFSVAGPINSLYGPTTATTPGQALGVLLDVSGTLNSQSQPYVNVQHWIINNAPHDDQTPQLTLVNPGQQITPGSSVGQGGLQVSVQYEGGPSVTPDRPIIFSVRSGGGSISGGGSLLATATLDPSRVVGGTFTGVVPFDGGTANVVSGTQYNIIAASQATPGKGWSIAVGDTRSDVSNVAVGGPTVALIEGAGFGGQTDAAINNGAQITRYDLGIAFFQGPTAPTPLTVTIQPSVQ